MSTLTPKRKAVLKSQYKSEFYRSSCCLTISVGQPAHEGEYLCTTIESVSKCFSSCIIIVGDTLQRHNLQILTALSDDQANLKAEQLGKQWYERNADMLNNLRIPMKVVYWDYWRYHINFQNKLMIIKNLYQKNVEFQQCIYDVAQEFINRNINKIAVISDIAFDLCKEYLLEECAGMLLWADDGIHFDVYPNNRNNAMNFVYRDVISNYDSSLVRHLRIKFKSRLELG